MFFELPLDLLIDRCFPGAVRQKDGSEAPEPIQPGILALTEGSMPGPRSDAGRPSGIAGPGFKDAPLGLRG